MNPHGPDHPPRRRTAIPRARCTELNALALKLRLGSFCAELLGWGFSAAGKWSRNYLHQHSYFEICYAYAGRGIFRMIGTDYAVARGDVFIAKPGEEHEIICNGEDPLGIYFWSYTLLPNAVPALPEKTPPGPPQPEASHEALDRLLHDFVGSRCWVSRRVPGMERTLELLTEEIARREPGYGSAVEGLTRKLLLDTARAAAGEARPGEAAAPRQNDPRKALADQATRYMRDNYGRIQSVKEIAAQVNLSERHFSRLYRAATGRSPLQALAELRLEAAAQWLLDRSLPIKEIAERVGYPDVRYFTTFFRRHTGLPPAQYRRTRGTRFRDPAKDRR